VRVKTAHLEIPAVSSKPTHQNQNDEDDQNDADDANAAVTEAVPVSAEAATKATQQEDDENNDEYESDRHDLSPVCCTEPNLPLARERELRIDFCRTGRAPSVSYRSFGFDRNASLAHVDLYAGGPLPLLVELITENQGGHSKHADDQIEHIAIHGWMTSIKETPAGVFRPGS
jgi:hypothetical protein